MTFNLDEYLDETQPTDFEFTYKGKDWSLIAFTEFDLDEFERLMNETNELVATKKALLHGLGEQATEFSKLKLTVRAVEMIFKEWQASGNLKAAGKGKS